MSQLDVRPGDLPPQAYGRIRVPGIVGASLLRAACLAVALGIGACREREDAGVIDRAVFIDSYVDLRKAALATPTLTLTAAERERVLAEHGVTDEDLLHFVDVKGADPEYMVLLWTDVGKRVPLAPLPPSAGGSIDSSTIK